MTKEGDAAPSSCRRYLPTKFEAILSSPPDLAKSRPCQTSVCNVAICWWRRFSPP